MTYNVRVRRPQTYFAPSGLAPGPQAIWQGFTDSTHAEVSWWPPAAPASTVTGYNVYRSGILVGPNVQPFTPAGGGVQQFMFTDSGLSNSNTYIYSVTAIIEGKETAPAVTTQTTLAGASTPPTIPAPALDPATWLPVYSLPVGGTRWTATNVASPNAAGSGVNNATGCGLQFAFTNAVPGDVIVITSNTIYTSSGGNQAFTAPAGGGPGWIYVTTDQDPGLGTGGTLPAYTSSTVLGGGNWIGPSNITSMATIQFSFSPNQGIGLVIPQGASFLRFVGINIQPAPSITQQMFLAVSMTQSGVFVTNALCDNIFFDRCMFGNDASTAGQAGSTFSWVRHGLGAVNASHFAMHQCYMRGFADNTGNAQRAGADAQALYSLGGGPFCIENCYIEGQSEGMIFGGGFVDKTQIPHDIVYRYNTNTKPIGWASALLGESVKNHFELKCGQRVACYGNLHLNNWYGFGSQGQHGRSFVIGGRDQQSGNAALPPTSTCPWNRVTDVDIHDNLIWNVGSGMYVFTSDICTSVFTARVRFVNNMVLVNPAVSQSCTCTASFSGTVMTVTAITSGQIRVGDAPVGAGISTSARVSSFGTGTGGTGTYNINTTINLASMTVQMNASKSECYGLWTDGPVSDTIIDHNTIIVNPANGVNTFSCSVYGIDTSGAPRNFPRASDRAQVTNNIFDGNTMLSGDSFIGSASGVLQPIIWTNSPQANNVGWNKNLPVIENNLNQALGTLPSAAGNYNAIGFISFTNNSTIPNPPANWDVTSTSNATASTTSGAVGATILNNLALEAGPRLFLRAISVSNIAPFTNTSSQQTYALHNVISWGCYAGVEGAMGQSFNTIMFAVKGFGATQSNIHCHTLLENNGSESSVNASSGTGPTYVKWCGDTAGNVGGCGNASANGAIAAANFWARNPDPSGAIVTQDTCSGNINFCPLSPHRDSNNRTAAQAYWFHFDTLQRLGGGVATLGYTSGQTFAANTNIEGYDLDNMDSSRETADWNCTGTSQSSMTTGLIAAYQQGISASLAAARVQFPAAILLINNDYFLHATGVYSTLRALDPSMLASADLNFCEVLVGQAGAIDGRAGTTFAQYMAALIAAEAIVNTNGALVYQAFGPGPTTTTWSNTSQASWTSADWQGARYHFCVSHLRNQFFSLRSGTLTYSTSVIYLMDEFGQPTINGRSYLGNPTLELPQSASRAKGVWWRVWPSNGTYLQAVVIANPRDNTAQTLNIATDMGLPGTWSTIKNLGGSFGDPAINTNSIVTSITLNPADGRVLVRTA